jgi:hypothetical protein
VVVVVVAVAVVPHRPDRAVACSTAPRLPRPQAGVAAPPLSLSPTCGSEHVPGERGPGRRDRSRRHQRGRRPGRSSRGTPGAGCRPATPLAVSGAAGWMPRPRGGARSTCRGCCPRAWRVRSPARTRRGSPGRAQARSCASPGRTSAGGGKPCNEFTCYGTVAAVTAVAVTRQPAPCQATDR